MPATHFCVKSGQFGSASNFHVSYILPTPVMVDPGVKRRIVDCDIHKCLKVSAHEIIPEECPALPAVLPLVVRTPAQRLFEGILVPFQRYVSLLAAVLLSWGRAGRGRGCRNGHVDTDDAGGRAGWSEGDSHGWGLELPLPVW